MIRATCPECNTRVDTFRFRGRRIFTMHGRWMTFDACPGSGWLVEDEDMATRTRKTRSDEGKARKANR